MDIQNLRAFLIIAREGSFSRGADRLHLTQPAVSKRIKALEEELDTRLFDRIGRATVLTEAGAALLPRARRILDEVEDARRALSRLAGHVGGTLKLATSHHVGLHRLPPVLRQFTACYPSVELALRFMDSEAACQAVAQGELELAVVTLPLEPPPALEMTELWLDRLHLVANRAHPLAAAPAPQAAMLSDYPAILPARGTYTRQIIEDTLAPLGVRIKEGLSTNFLETIKTMVSVGLGWSVLPETVIDSEVQRLAIAEPAIERRLGVVRHRSKTLSNAAGAMLKVLGDHRERFE